ncbi:MAG: hypothetical protein WAN72_20560 [Candidatus Acidiferrales bacterium]
MEHKIKEHWLELCEKAANEEDPAKMIEIVEEINRLLGAKYDHISPATGTSKDST